MPDIDAKTEYTLPAELQAAFMSAACDAAVGVLNTREAKKVAEAEYKAWLDAILDFSRPIIAVAENLRGHVNISSQEGFDFQVEPGGDLNSKGERIPHLQISIFFTNHMRYKTGTALCVGPDKISVEADDEKVEKFSLKDGSTGVLEKSVSIKIVADAEDKTKFSIQKIECGNLTEPDGVVGVKPETPAAKFLVRENVTIEKALEILGKSVGEMSPELFVKLVQESAPAVAVASLA